ncbi:hypothetical protein OAO87_04460, partial [bacterium]|nr:hypothetical protein [bacterium]
MRRYLAVRAARAAHAEARAYEKKERCRGVLERGDPERGDLLKLGDVQLYILCPMPSRPASSFIHSFIHSLPSRPASSVPSLSASRQGSFVSVRVRYADPVRGARSRAHDRRGRVRGG